MSRKEIMYVAYKDEPLDDEISYALYLAGLMDVGLRVVLLSRNSLAGLSGKFDNLMAAVTFAEADGHETAGRTSAGETGGKDAASIQRHIVERCNGEGVRVNVHIGLEATVAVVQDFIKRKKLELVLLSPAVTHSRNILPRLLKNSSRPIVTMAHGIRNSGRLMEGGRSA